MIIIIIIDNDLCINYFFKKVDQMNSYFELMTEEDIISILVESAFYGFVTFSK